MCLPFLSVLTHKPFVHSTNVRGNDGDVPVAMATLAAVARYGDSVQKPSRRAAARAGFLLALLEELVSGSASAEALAANDAELFLDVFAAMYGPFHFMAPVMGSRRLHLD
jgi:hypothetical protein